MIKLNKSMLDTPPCALQTDTCPRFSKICAFTENPIKTNDLTLQLASCMATTRSIPLDSSVAGVKFIDYVQSATTLSGYERYGKLIGEKERENASKIPRIIRQNTGAIFSKCLWKQPTLLTVNYRRQIRDTRNFENSVYVFVLSLSVDK